MGLDWKTLTAPRGASRGFENPVDGVSVSRRYLVGIASVGRKVKIWGPDMSAKLTTRAWCRKWMGKC